MIKDMKFGLTKAKMIMSCIDQIRAFCDSEGCKPPTNSEIYNQNKENGIVCYCKRFNFFVTSSGREINKPYLKIWSGDTQIGFGLEKAKGIIILRTQIKEFINKYDY